MVIEKNRNYNVSQAMQFMPFKSREVLIRYARRYQGASWSIGKMRVLIGKSFCNNKKKQAKRYYFKGTWLKEFLKRYDKKKLKDYEIFKPEDVKFTLKDMLAYCQEHGIYKVSDFILAINKQIEEEQLEEKENE